MKGSLLIALAGQPNCGKSTIFNGLTGARQHVANYPGVTVEKKVGFFSLGGYNVELVDLPGTYSLTSYSLEERVARDFLLYDSPKVVINIIDASNVKRGLYLTLQLLEMGVSLIVTANMMDVAKRRSITLDLDGLSTHLQVPVIPAVGTGKSGIALLRSALAKANELPSSSYVVDYGTLEPFLGAVEKKLATEAELRAVCSPRWLAVKLMEKDSGAEELIQKYAMDAKNIMLEVESQSEAFLAEKKMPPARHIAFARHKAADKIAKKFVVEHEKGKPTLSDKVDKIICHKVFGPVILVGILVLLYQIAIVFGNHVAAFIWPFWDMAQTLFASVLPEQGFLEDPELRSLGVWSMKSMTAVLNYLPIFFLLFSCIAILEDSGYMPRMAFILDRLFRRFGLHGQSTLPLILGGVYVGGCAIPAVMATKAIPDEKARLATIMIAPMMNCLAKVPLYLIMISAFFPETSGSAMFFIATVTMLMALPVAKILSLTVLKGKPSAPFIMEMPPYHLPTVQGVLSRAIERIWLFFKKITTVVLAVAIIVYALISFPKLGEDEMQKYVAAERVAIDSFLDAIEKTKWSGDIFQEDVQPLILFEEALKEAKRGVTDQAVANEIDEKFAHKNATYFGVVRGTGADAKILRKAFRDLGNERKNLRRELKNETFENSFLGICGKALEPVTKYAGFNWKINIALLSAFAAKENSAATLGAVYGLDGEGSVEADLRSGEPGFTPLHALSLMLFMALYPPCIPTSIMVRLQAGSTGWMLFSIVYQTFLGLAIAVAVFSGGTFFELSGVQAMWVFYGICLLTTIGLGVIPDRKIQEKKQKNGDGIPIFAEVK